MFLMPRFSADDRSPFGDFWFTPVGVHSIAGQRVTADSALRLSAVYACVRVLAETMATLPFCLYQVSAGGTKTPVRDHWLYRLFAKRPNRWQTPFEFREMLEGHLAMRGNAYCRIASNGRGEIVDLTPIHPDAVSIELLPSGDYRYRLKKRDGSTETVVRGEIWHIRGLSSDGLMGMSPLELARETIGAGLAAQDYAGRFWANDARPGGVIEMPGSFKDNAARGIFRETWQKAQSGENRHKVAVLEQGMQYKELGITNRDAQFLELRQFTVTDVARVFRIPPHLVGDLSRATFGNIEHQSLEFATYTMAPWCERWEASIESDLLLETDDGLEVEFDMGGLMRGDAAARANFYASGISAGWLTRNEARSAENLNPIDGLDEPLRPLNMTTEDDAAEIEDVAAGPAEDDAAKPEPDEAAEARLRAVVRSQAERLAKRFAPKFAALFGHIDGADALVIAEAMAVPLERVNDWRMKTEQPAGGVTVAWLAAELENL